MKVRGQLMEIGCTPGCSSSKKLEHTDLSIRFPLVALNIWQHMAVQRRAITF
jgi:hypothetical protein